MNSNSRSMARGRSITAWLCLSFVLLLAACGGGGGGGNTDEGAAEPVETAGDIVIGLTDAEGDFLSYTVNVLSLQLTRADGSEVETLPLATTVDFAQYTELTEFFTAATIPSGVYVSATMVLDYSAAQIVVEDAAGEAREATAVDADGDALAQLQVSVNFSDRDSFRVAPGIPAHITLDFDLESSHEVDLAQAPALVTVDPVLIADTLLEEPKTHRLRGLLGEVSEAEAVFTVKVRPFYRLQGDFGSLRVAVTGETFYEINQEGFTGAAGLAQLAAQPENTALVVLGELSRTAVDDSFEFVASEVFAGTSVPWGDGDLVTGHVVARSGDILTVLGATVIRADNQISFRDTVTVTLGEDTVVTQQGSAVTLDKDAVSVGQRLNIRGELTQTDGSELDATAGQVRLRYTTVSGVVVQSSPLVVDLQAINRRRVGLFDFSGTGTVADQDADPDHYEVDTGTLSLESVAAGDPIKVRGFVTGFGQAPADFGARTLVTVEDTPARLAIRWTEGGSPEPFVAINDESLVVDMDSGLLGEVHHVYRNGVAVDLTALGLNTTLTEAAGMRGLYVIAGQGELHMFTDFTDYTAEILQQLDGSVTVKTLHGRGGFNDPDATLSARRLVIRMGD